jgi:hypothetical protein
MKEVQKVKQKIRMKKERRSNGVLKSSKGK